MTKARKAPKREPNKLDKLSVDFKYGFELKTDLRTSPRCASCFNYLEREYGCAKVAGFITSSGVCKLHKEIGGSDRE